MTGFSNFIIRGAAMAVFLMLAACARDTVTLLPGADGASSGTVAVLAEDGSSVALIDKPYQVGRIDGTEVESATTNAAEVQQDFGALIETLPPEPSVYVLYFQEGTADLLAEYVPLLDKLLVEVGNRPGVEVQVTGHTDTVGSTADNDALSKRRADLIRNLLIVRGVPAGDIISVGRGERELLVQTDDNVDEPKNRRVEVTVR